MAFTPENRVPRPGPGLEHLPRRFILETKKQEGGLLLKSSPLGRQVSGAGQSPDVQAMIHLPEEQETPSEKQEASQEGVSLPYLGKLLRTWKLLGKHSWKC